MHAGEFGRGQADARQAARAADDELIRRSLGLATDTTVVKIGEGVLDDVVAVFRQAFGDAPAVVVADRNTMQAAGRRVCDAFAQARHPLLEPLLIPGDEPKASYDLATSLADELRGRPAVAVAVGSGTVNDLAKLASHLLERKYMAVGTAASMDGYTAYGASITRDGYKITHACPAPRAFLADTAVFARAPRRLNSAGYADLLAKVVSGADWLLADALGIEPVHPAAWALIQDRLRAWVADPEGILQGSPAAAESLMTGLVMAGLAMQAMASSRCASGAEHQFSHLWDMQGHTHEGHLPFHGFKVGIGSLTSAALHQFCQDTDFSAIDIEAACADWPDPREQARRIAALHAANGIPPSVLPEVTKKLVDAPALRQRLEQLAGCWPGLRPRLGRQLIPPVKLRQMLQAAGCPVEPEAIGITRARLHASVPLAHSIRSRYTVLDLLVETGLRNAAETAVFGAGGFWDN